jgi:hypothetical protein
MATPEARVGFFRPSRTGRANRWFEWKVRAFMAGAGLGLVGIFLDDHRVVVGALVVLTVGMVFRFLPDEQAPPAGPGGADGDDEEDREGDGGGGAGRGR